MQNEFCVFVRKIIIKFIKNLKQILRKNVYKRFG